MQKDILRPADGLQPIIDLTTAFQLGVMDGRRDCTPGSFFRSAYGAARETPYPEGSTIRQMYVQGYMSECPSCLMLDDEGFVKAGPPAQVRVIGVGMIDNGYARLRR